MPETTPPATAGRQKLTEKRKEVFLRVLAETGVAKAAARAASPHGRGDSTATFRDEARRDPRFAAAWREALREADERLEEEAHRRAVTGIKEPVFQKGERVVDANGEPAFVVRYSDRLLELLLRARVDKFVERRELHHSGSVAHGPADRLSIGVSDLDALSPTQREQLRGILQTIAEARGEYDADGERPALADDRAGAVDAEFSEVPGGLSEDEERELAEVNR